MKFNKIYFPSHFIYFIHCKSTMEAAPLTDQFIVYPKRFFIVFLFSLAQLMTSCLINTLTPIAKYLQDIYEQDPLIVNSGALLFALMHPVFTFPASYAIDTYGTKAGIAIGSALCLLGTGVRLFVNNSFSWVIVGQVIAGIGRPFILNCQAKISANWFTAQKRGGITQLLTLILNVSLIIGLLIPGVVFGKYEWIPENPETVQQGKDKTFNLMFVQFIMAIVCFVPNLFLQTSKPPTPPSYSAVTKRDTFKQSMKSLMKNRDYILLLCAFGCYFGIFNGLSIILSYLLNPWFHENLAVAVGYVGGSPVVSGIIGIIILGPMQRKSGKFKKFITFCMIGSCSAMILFYPLLETNMLVFASLVSAYNSFFLIPLVPIMLQLACQTAFPVGEGTAAGLLFAMGNFSGFLFGTLLSIIVRGESKGQTAGGLGFCFGVFLVGLGLIYFMRQRLNRSDSQKRSSGVVSELGDKQSTTVDEKSKSDLKQNLLAPAKGANADNALIQLY